MAKARDILWQPSALRANHSRMAQYTQWLQEERDLTFEDYNALWTWSVTEIEAFWESICDFFDVPFSAPHTSVLNKRIMPGAKWFEGARLNYVDSTLRYALAHGEDIALICQSEIFGRKTLTWGALHAQVTSVASNLADMGVGKGDRVVAVLPNTTEAVVAFYAVASLGAIWSLCAPDMGHVAIVDRFKQIEPKVLITQDRYVHAGRSVDRSDVIKIVADSLPTVEHHIQVATDTDAEVETSTWSSLLDRKAVLKTAQVPFDHPLWVVYSSGTTGNPKPIVHGHGGALIGIRPVRALLTSILEPNSTA